MCPILACLAPLQPLLLGDVCAELWAQRLHLRASRELVSAAREAAPYGRAKGRCCMRLTHPTCVVADPRHLPRPVGCVGQGGMGDLRPYAHSFDALHHSSPRPNPPSRLRRAPSSARSSTPCCRRSSGSQASCGCRWGGGARHWGVPCQGVMHAHRFSNPGRRVSARRRHIRRLSAALLPPGCLPRTTWNDKSMARVCVDAWQAQLTAFWRA